MKSSRKATEDSQGQATLCPGCGASDVRTTMELDTFPYGDGPNAVALSARVPVQTCEACGFQFTDYVAERLRHEAVCHHLGLMTPNEVKKLRQRYSCSQSEFARLTRIGEASLSRWETGQLIQNAAYDQLLYLLTFSDNLERLRERGLSVPGP